MFNNNDSSMVWLLILFMLSMNGQNFNPPTNEEMCTVFLKAVDTYLEDNKHLVEKANIGSPLWQLKHLREAVDGIEDIDTKLKVVEVAMSIMRNIEAVNKYACGGLPSCETNPTEI